MSMQDIMDRGHLNGMCDLLNFSILRHSGTD